MDTNVAIIEDSPATLADREESLPQRLRAARVSCDLSLRQMARVAGLSRAHLGEIERGRAHASPAVLDKIARALHTTVEDLLDGVPYRPRQGGRPALTCAGAVLRRTFRPPRVQIPPETLYHAFRLARHTVHGSTLLAKLDQQQRSREEWRLIKALATKLNGPEQEFVLHLLVNGGTVEERHPFKLGFVRPVVDDCGGWFYSVVVTVPELTIAVYPQLGVTTGKGWYCTIDFLICAGDGRRTVFISGEVDSKWHANRRGRDARRDEFIALPSMRMPDSEVDRADFFPRFARSVKARLEGVPRGAGRSDKLRPPA